MMEYITRTAPSTPALESIEIAPNILTSFTFDNDTEPDEVNPQNEKVRMIQVIARPPIIVLGTIGNLLTFITMQRGSLKHIYQLVFTWRFWVWQTQVGVVYIDLLKLAASSIIYVGNFCDTVIIR